MAISIKKEYDKTLRLPHSVATTSSDFQSLVRAHLLICNKFDTSTSNVALSKYMFHLKKHDIPDRILKLQEDFNLDIELELQTVEMFAVNHDEYKLLLLEV